MNKKNEAVNMFGILAEKTNKGQYKEILDIVTRDVFYNRVKFRKKTSLKELADLIQSTYKIVVREELMWTKMCTNCGYVSWSLSFSGKCGKCGAKAICNICV